MDAESSVEASVRRVRSLGDLDPPVERPTAPPRASELARPSRQESAIPATEHADAAMELPAPLAPVHARDRRMPAPTARDEFYQFGAAPSSAPSFAFPIADAAPPTPEPPEHEPEPAVRVRRAHVAVPGLSMPFVRRALTFFGRGQSGTRQRRALVSLVWAVIVTSTEARLSTCSLDVYAHGHRLITGCGDHHAHIVRCEQSEPDGSVGERVGGM
jgi:hypothetical protein